MSNKVATLVRSRIIGSAALKAVLLNMADKANDEGAEIYSSKATVAAETELGRRTVFRSVDELISLGLVTQAGERPCRYGYTVIYRLDLAAISQLPAWRADQSQAATPNSRTSRAHQCQDDTPTSATVAPHQCQGDTPTSATVAPKPSLEPSMNHPFENEDDGEGDARAQMREEKTIDGWTDTALLDAVIRAAEADPGHRNWRSPAVKGTVWGWLGHYGISPAELLEVIKGSRRGHSHELPNSPQAFIGDLEAFVKIRQWNLEEAGAEYSPPPSAPRHRRSPARPPQISVAEIMARIAAEDAN